MKHAYPWRSLALASLLVCFAALAQAQYSITAFNTPVNENFDNLSATATSVGGPAGELIDPIPNLGTNRWQAIRQGGSGGGTGVVYAGASDGSGTGLTGAVYNAGLSGNANRMIALLSSGTTNPAFATRFTNNTGSVINSLTITYLSAQWRAGSNSLIERMAFQYRIGATGVGDPAAWTAVPDLDFVEIQTADNSNGALNGTLASNQRSVSFTITGLGLANGATIWIRWTDFNDTGSDCMMAMDNLVVTAPSVTPPSVIPIGEFKLFLSPGAGSPSTHQTANISGTNLTSDITINVPAQFQARLETETDASYRSTVTLSPTSGTVAPTNVRFRFNPTANGLRYGVGTITATGITPLQGVLIGTTAGLGTLRAEQRTRINTTQTARGRIHTLGSFNRSELIIQDGTGGLVIFVENEPIPGAYFASLGLAVGDSITVVGTLKEFQPVMGDGGSGQLQIGGTAGGTMTITKHSFVSATFSPIGVSAAGFADSLIAEAIESCVVGFANVAVTNQGYAYWREELNYTAQDGSIGFNSTTAASFTIRTSRRTDIFNNNTTTWQATTIPATITAMQGIGGQFQGAHQVRLRRRADIAGATNTPYLNTSNLAIAQNLTLDVASWNIKWFGDPTRGPSQDIPAAQADSAAKLIVALGLDLVAVQEIFSATLFNDAGNPQSLVNRLNVRAPAGTSYGAVLAPGPNQQQVVGFVYKATEGGSAVITPAMGTNPSMLLTTAGSTGWAAFSGVRRVPAEFRFTYNAGAQGNQDLRIISLHGDAGGDATSRNNRETDYTELKTFLDANRASDRVIIAGDYNDLVIGSIVGGSANSPMKMFVDDPADYRALTTDIHPFGVSSFASGPNVSLIDHIIVTNELFPNLLVGTTRPFNPWPIIENYTFTTADHYPVGTRLRFDLTLSEDGSVTRPSSAYNLKVYPNPSSGQLTVDFDLLRESDVTVTLLDATGATREVLMPARRFAAGQHAQTLTTAVAPGLYLLSVDVSGNARETRKVVVAY